MLANFVKNVKPIGLNIGIIYFTIAFSTKDSISIYIHWPFCKSKCPYCDFNSHVSNYVDHDLFEKAYIKELEAYLPVLRNKTIKSIFFGGGTPSLAQPSTFAAIINWLNKNSDLPSNTEITMEANPTSVEAIKFKEFKLAGINRLSLGIQSLNDHSLKFLGREHSSLQAKNAIDIARTTFPNYSFDLIYALPEQTLKEWEYELNSALNFVDQHMSLYQLTIEKGTPFFNDFRDKKFKMPTDDLSADFYELTNYIMRSHDYNRYEVSNYAKSGSECVHNLCYWEYGNYLGIGPGAHGRYEEDGIKYATMMTNLPKNWIELVNKNGIGLQNKEALTLEQTRQEKVIMGMRLEAGIDCRLINNNIKLSEAVELELVKISGNKVHATEKGFLVLNNLILNLLS